VKLLRVIISDLHRDRRSQGAVQPFEDFYRTSASPSSADYTTRGGSFEAEGGELILNGDIFDLMKVEIDGVWPTAISESVAVERCGAASRASRVVAWLKMFPRQARQAHHLHSRQPRHRHRLSAVQQLLRTYWRPGLSPRGCGSSPRPRATR